MTQAPVLSHIQASPLARAWRDGASEHLLSLDLELSTEHASLSEAGCVVRDRLLAWSAIDEIAGTHNGCFLLDETEGGWTARKIFIFSETTRRHVSLYPTQRAPALLVAGLPMHRIKGVDPLEDTRLKIKAAAPQGMVLDTSMGLGYTAIEAARRAQHVLTLEIDPAVAEVAALNPYSRELFDSPRIERRIADSAEAIQDMDDGLFNCVIHDPPTVTLAGDLYAGAYYRDLYRILRKGGRLFHYIGDLASPSGARTVRGVIERLNAAGFRDVSRRPESFAVVAHK